MAPPMYGERSGFDPHISITSTLSLLLPLRKSVASRQRYGLLSEVVDRKFLFIRASTARTFRQNDSYAVKIFIRFVRVMMVVSGLAMTVAITSRAAEKLPAHPKLVYRQIAAGWTLALESNRREKTFFLCDPSKTNCISTKEVGWRKPFIIARDGSLVGRGYSIVDTSSSKSAGAVNKSLASHLKTIPIYPPAVAWEKLSPTKTLW
jgi:hypothetical protein